MFRSIVKLNQTLFPTSFQRRFVVHETINYPSKCHQFRPDHVDIYKESFTVLGLSENQTSTILASCPEISNVSFCDLQKTIDVLMQCQFGQEDLSALIVKHPYLLCIHPQCINDTYKNLIGMLKKKTVYNIMYNAPRIINEPWPEVEKKFKYLEKEMFVSVSEIAKSGALGYPISYIQERHIFLSRVGVFKQIKPKLKPHLRSNINPQISDILNSSDFVFSTKISGVTLLEFEVFQGLFSLEKDDL